MVYNEINYLDECSDNPGLLYTRPRSRSMSYTELAVARDPSSSPTLGLAFANASDSNLSYYSFASSSRSSQSNFSSSSLIQASSKRKSPVTNGNGKRSATTPPLMIDTNGLGLTSSLVITNTDSRQISYTTPNGSVQLLRLSKLRNECLMKGSASQILPYLYLGNKYDAHDIAYLQSHNIRYILNISRHLDRIQVTHSPGFECKYIHVRDDPDQEIMFYFQAAFDFIEKARRDSGNVLVHCSHGVSRSPTIVIAYLMKHIQFSLTEAFDLVKTKRPGISPNIGFYSQLKEYEMILLG